MTTTRLETTQPENNEDADIPKAPSRLPPPPGTGTNANKAPTKTSSVRKISSVNPAFLAQLNTQLSNTQHALPAKKAKPIVVLSPSEQEILKKIHFLLVEFIKTRESFFNSMTLLHSKMQTKISELKKPIGLTENLQYQLILFANQRLQEFSRLPDPFPGIKELLKANPFNVDDFIACVDILYQGTVNPAHNTVFKERALHCTWFTLYRPALLKTVFSDLIEPLQNLARMSLFSKGGLNSFTDLFESPEISPALHNQLKPLQAQLEELTLKSLMIALATNTMLPSFQSMLSTIKTVPEFKLRDIPFVDIGLEIACFMQTIVQFILESEITDSEQFKKRYESKIQAEFVDAIVSKTSVPIFPNDLLYHHFIDMLDQCTSSKKDQIELMKDKLRSIHEDPSMSDEALKLVDMKNEITTFCQSAKSSSSNFFGGCPSASDLQKFVATEMDKYHMGEMLENTIDNRRCVLF